ncbi:hypothetical protein AQUCO_03700135v1 [Aquilegia coerulea]|uniref:DUF7356 domain-containing protein n=1 Tax=Aquilegia coerulea TaxID=218851 RepID=A0A2G5CTM3_AQUCA|nr:hypothetical protein AQUCO_03700135v1 [Aquilegia coerulea]PIA34632.1 hypothetical protein AQUCO_03700135v1 [Aquilegia coerulea]PIA34633.1 hypothetical protein AQUCO_03700135v1 [Aquilegia coerulea]PIA34634.1 hypothetical protein AQUCO_03700135v1 [Aquilegia coerulea]PIA34635.1 hypothetical protein AQUCO_03700135v1 [Aquilegia coerulea]
MENHGTILTLLVLSTLVLVCFGAELKTQTVDPASRNEPNNTSTSDASLIKKPNEPKVSVDDQIKKSDQIESEGETNNVPDTNTANKGLNSEDVPKEGSGKGALSEKPHVQDGNEKEKAGDGLEPKTVPKEVTTGGNSDPLKPPKKDSARGEECGSSSKCTDEKHKLIACLRVPGNESPELSLLIQNKGTKPLNVKISAPDYVRLENNSVHLPAKENQKVKVSIGKGSKDALIVLTVKDAKCSIDFKDLILHNVGKKTDETAKSQLNDIITKVPSIVLIAVVTVMLVASVWMCIRFRRMQLNTDGSKYQKLETELPVSGGGKKESDDGWDESWGDSWDDEEAPKTPSLPITPSLSSKGLASRKLSKDAWKD